MIKKDLWEECCKYLRREGWGDLGFLKLENPSEYRYLRRLFKELEAKFSSSPELFKGAGAIKGIGDIPSVVGLFLLPYGWAQLYKPGNPFRRYLLQKGIDCISEEIKCGTGRPRSETKRISWELMAIPKSELLRQEKIHRPDGSDSAVSRASDNFHSEVSKWWEDFTGTSAWSLGIFQFFLWKLGGVPSDEAQIENTISSEIIEQFNQNLLKAKRELEKYGPPSEEEIIDWNLKYYGDLKREIAKNPRLLPLLLPLVIDPNGTFDAVKK